MSRWDKGHAGLGDRGSMAEQGHEDERYHVRYRYAGG